MNINQYLVVLSKINDLECQTMCTQIPQYDRLGDNNIITRFAMKDARITVRIEPELKAELQLEAKKRGQDVGPLIRTFVIDGLSRYDAMSEQILQNGEDLQRMLTRVERAVGANLHAMIEHQVLAMKPHDGESQDDYANRMRALYKEKIHKAVEKGAAIKDIT